MIRGNDIYDILKEYSISDSAVMRISVTPDRQWKKIHQYTIIDPAAIIILCRLFQNYDLAFAFGVIPNFENFDQLSREFGENYDQILRHVEVVFEAGEISGISGVYVCIEYIKIQQIALTKEGLYDRIFQQFFPLNKTFVRKRDRVVGRKKEGTTNKYFLSYKIA